MTLKSYEDFNRFKKETKVTNIFLSSIGAIIYSHMKTRSNTIHYHIYQILQMNQILKSKQMAFETFLPYERNCFTHVRRTNVSVQYCFNASCTLLIIDFALMLYIYLHQLIL